MMWWSRSPATIDDGVRRVEDRVNNISDGSAEDADMDVVNIEKTVVMHVRVQEKPSPTTI